MTVSGRWQQCRGPSHRQPARKFRGRALDRRAAEQSARHSGHRDPTDLSAGSQWGFRTRRRRLRKLLSAFRCAARERRTASCSRCDERARLVADLLTELAEAVPGSAALLRGSLAEGRADLSSDIDLLWEIPDTDFGAAIAALPVTLACVRPVAWLRFDPDFQKSAWSRRLAFIRFANVPLF